MSSSRPLLLAVLVASPASLGVLWATAIPLGVPGEWTWERIGYPAELQLDLLFGLSIAGVAGAGYVAFALYGGRHVECVSRPALVSRLALLAGFGFAWLLAVQSVPRPPHDLSKSSLVLYSPAASGYFHEAVHGGWTTGAFLEGYEQRMREGDVLHVGTHPPGLFLWHRGLIEACRSSPALTDRVLSTRPESVREVEREVLPMIDGRWLGPPDLAALWLAALLTNLAAAATVIPLFALVRRTAGRRSAWLAAAFWPLVPALAVFLPKSDALYPVIATAFLWLWLEAARRPSWKLAAAAGFLFWCGLWLSLALLPTAVLAAVLSVAERGVGSRAERWSRLRGLAAPVTVAGGVFVAATLLTWAATGANLFNVWWLNLRNHAGFYDRFTRTYETWLLVNPPEMAFAIGMPVAVLFAWVLFRAIRRGEAASVDGDRGRVGWLVPVACFGVWALLWLSGKNSGEAARLWLVLAPWPIWSAFALGVRGDSEATLGRGWTALLALQALVSALTVARVSGFHFGG